MSVKFVILARIVTFNNIMSRSLFASTVQWAIHREPTGGGRSESPQ